jgi:DNA-binding MarR family transcriptional regulator
MSAMKDAQVLNRTRQATNLIFGVAKAMRTILDRQLEPLSVTGQQAAMMLNCARDLGESFDRLAKSLGTDSAGVTRLADRLEMKGLLIRKPDEVDRRATRLVLSSAGRDLLPALRRSIGRWREQVLKGVSDAELSQLERLLHRILGNIESEQENL